MFGHSNHMTLMAQCKTAATPVHYQWSYHNHVLSHRHDILYWQKTLSILFKFCWKIFFGFEITIGQYCMNNSLTFYLLLLLTNSFMLPSCEPLINQCPSLPWKHTLLTVLLCSLNTYSKRKQNTCSGCIQKMKDPFEFASSHWIRMTGYPNECTAVWVTLESSSCFIHGTPLIRVT